MYAFIQQIGFNLLSFWSFLVLQHPSSNVSVQSSSGAVELTVQGPLDVCPGSPLSTQSSQISDTSDEDIVHPPQKKHKADFVSKYWFEIINTAYDILQRRNEDLSPDKHYIYCTLFDWDINPDKS